MAQRKFNTGATRNSDGDKFDYEGFLSPLVLKRFGAYMHKNRTQEDGSLRASDNWQLGIEKSAYAKSLLRHTIDLWLAHRGWPHDESLEDSLCAIIFNAQGMLHEILKGAPAPATTISNELACRCTQPIIGHVPYKGKVCRECGGFVQEGE